MSDIRVAINIDQKTEDYQIPLSLKLVKDNGDPVDVFGKPNATTPLEQPISFDEYPAQVFLDDGGDYKMLFTWKASDNSERTFEESLEIPIPPQCPRCERRVPELNAGDYLCDDCRYG